MNKKDASKLLIEEFPKLYENATCGVNCPPGWYNLVRGLSIQLKDTDTSVAQVKSKFGGLRYYLHNYMPAWVYILIDAAECASFKICERCGDPGKSYTINKIVWTLCENCEETERR